MSLTSTQGLGEGFGPLISAASLSPTDQNLALNIVGRELSKVSRNFYLKAEGYTKE